MAKITLADLQNPQDSASSDKNDRGVFLAETLSCDIVTPAGDTIATVELEPRAFTPKESKNSSKPLGGVGWYCNIQPKDGAEYRGLKLSGGFRLSVSGVKIGAGDVVDLMPRDSE